MTNKVTVRQFITPLLISAVLVCVAVPVLLPIISQQPQVYEDIIIEWTSLQNLNRSGELRLLWCLFAVSAAIVILWHFTISKRQIGYRETKFTWNDTVIFLLLGPCFINFLFFSIIDGYMLFLAALAMTLAACKILTYRNILLMGIVYFAILGVAAATMPLGLPVSPHIQTRLILMTIFVFILIMLTEQYIYKKAVWQFILVLQVLVPLILLYFLHDQYNLNGALTKIPFDRGYIYMVKLGIAAAVLHSLYSVYATFKKNCHIVPPLNDLILTTTLVAIFIFNSVNAPLPMLRDWHHAAEHFVPFQQVIDFGKTLYGDYLSVSGCYPMLFGFVQRFLLNNTVASYYQAETLLNMVSCALGGILLHHAFGKKCAFFIALTCMVAQGYTRIVPLLPFLLILMVPRIVANRHLWLQIYVICSMLLGLYYPLYGGAYLLGALPFAIVQVRELLSAKKISSKYPLCLWGIVMILVLICSPLLLRLAQYTLIISSQALLANGMSIFDHESPHYFLQFIYSTTIRKVLYFCTAYYLQILCAILPLSLCVCYVFFTKKVNKYSSISFFVFSFAAIMLPIIYSYSWIRMDFGFFMFRTETPFSVISIILFGSLWRYGRAILTPRTILMCFSLLLAINYHFYIPRPPFSAPPQPHAIKLFTPPPFNASWQLASQDIQVRFPRLGAVILRQTDIDYMNRIQVLLEKTRDVPAPLLELPRQMSYFLFDKEASVTGTINILGSTVAHNKAINIMEQNPPICVSINSLSHYVLYRWILDTGYVNFGGIAVPRKFAGHVPLTTTPDYSTFHGFGDVQNIANSLGKSLSTLMPMFIEQSLLMRTQITHEKETATITVDFERTIDGREVDFIFVDLANNNRPKHETFKSYFEIDDRQLRYQTYNVSLPPRLLVRASWTGEDGVFEKKNSMEMAFGNGKLLMPLGANPWWLNGKNKILKLEIYGKIATDESFSLNAIQLLQFKSTAKGMPQHD